MALNPVWNQFNVAPVGPIIMVGHKRALSGGITRESALNLIAWLSIACEATPEEIAAEIAKAHTPTPAMVPQVPAQVVVPAAMQGNQTPAQPGGAPIQQRPGPGGSTMIQRPSPTMQMAQVPPTVAHAAQAPQGRPPGGPLVGNIVAVQRPSPRLQGRPDDSAAVAATLDPNRPPPEATVMTSAGVVVRPPVAPKVPPAAKPAPTAAASTDGDPNTLGPETVPFVDRSQLDPETEAALREAEQAAAAVLDAPVTPVDENKVAAAWNGKGAST